MNQDMAKNFLYDMIIMYDNEGHSTQRCSPELCTTAGTHWGQVEAGTLGKHLQGPSLSPQGEASGMRWKLKIAEADGKLVKAERFRKLLLTHPHPLKPWPPTPTPVCSVTFDTNLLTKVTQNQNGIPEDSSQQQVLADLG
jgi:hypothetical protein